MNIFLYIVIFLIGITFGSFYTLAVYRIPLKQDITHTHSYCPNCKHKLGFWDLIPVFSYIFLGGKCRYCKQKIRPRYIILETLSGICFVLYALFLKINIYTLTIEQIVEFLFFALLFTFIVLLIGIYCETKKVNKNVLIYGFTILIIYVIYFIFINYIH